MSSFSRRPLDQRGHRHEETQRWRATPDGPLNRGTSLLKPAYSGDATRYANDDRAPRGRPRPRPQPLGILILRQGAESEQTFELRHNPTTIGRSRESDIVLDDDAVSRAHAIVMCDEVGTYFIRDHNSGNGTFVNGQRVTEFELEDGDEIQVGLVVLEFRLSEP